MRSPRSASAWAALAAGLCLGSGASGQVQFTQAATGLARPNFVTSPAGEFDRLFITEQFTGTPSSGRVRLYRVSTGAMSTFLSIPGVSNGNEQGLLGLAFHPGFATNRKFYVNFTDANWTTTVREYQVFANNRDLADPSTARTILTVAQPQDNHNGGWLAFGRDGMLYIATGDGGNRDDSGGGHTEPGGNAQDVTSNLLGKILRVDVDGDDFPGDAGRNYRIPTGNPFVGRTGDDEIWAYGLRNPWRNSFDRATGDLWIGDVGQDVWEEIDAAVGNPGGRNYGWRCMEGEVCTGFDGCVCNAASLADPVYVYQHASNRCAVTGGYVYRGCQNPAVSGWYVFADYCTGEVFGRNPGTGAVTLLTSLGFGLTSFGEDAYGELWAVRQNGRLYKMTPAAGAPAFVDCNGNGRPDCWDLADGRSVDRNGNGTPDECDPPCAVDFNGDGFVDFFDYDAFVTCFETGVCPAGRTGDFNGDGFADFFDYDAFVSGYEAGC